MNKLYKKSEIWFAIVWIIIYVAGSSVAEGISETIGIQKSVTLFAHAFMCMIALIWLKKNDLYEKYVEKGEDAVNLLSHVNHPSKLGHELIAREITKFFLAR